MKSWKMSTDGYLKILDNKAKKLARNVIKTGNSDTKFLSKMKTYCNKCKTKTYDVSKRPTAAKKG